MNKYYISLCLLCKDENDYLEEWITYHKNIGIDHFYIYDHQSKIPLATTCQKYIDEGILDVILWVAAGTRTQTGAYEDCCEKFKEDNRWIGFIDTDEFLVIKKPYNTIKKFMQQYENLGGLGINWLMFGSSHLETKPESMLKGFFMSAKNDYHENKHIKTIINPKLVTKFASPHHAHLIGTKPTKWYYNSSKINKIMTKISRFFSLNFRKSFNNKSDIVNENFEEINYTEYSVPSLNKCQINHYYTRSKQEFLKKQERGRGDQVGKRENEEFYGKLEVLNQVNQTENMHHWLRFAEKE